MNLVINASEALPDGRGSILVATGVIDCDAESLAALGVTDIPPGRYVRLSVTDTGTGMDAATRARVFEPFFTTKFIGRGLGLASVLGIVRGHHGSIRVMSEPGRSTTFEVFFPTGARPPEPLARRAGECAEWQGAGTVLLVDDDDSVRGAARAMMETLGFCVLTASDGNQAIGVFHAHRDEIDCVLLDLTMPGLDGAETYSQLKALRGDVKVILCSGYDEKQTSLRFAGMGFSGFLQKPFQLATLRDCMRRVMGDGP